MKKALKALVADRLLVITSIIGLAGVLLVWRPYARFTVHPGQVWVEPTSGGKDPFGLTPTAKTNIVLEVRDGWVRYAEYSHAWQAWTTNSLRIGTYTFFYSKL